MVVLCETSSSSGNFHGFTNIFNSIFYAILLQRIKLWFYRIQNIYTTHTHTQTHTYTGCPRRNVPDFGRVFLMLKYTDITQNTYIQSWTVMEIMAREKCGLLAVPRTGPFQLTRYMYTAHVLETGMQSTLCLRAHVKCLEPKGRLRR